MKQIISIALGSLALSAIALAAASAVSCLKERRKPVMTFRELYCDNSAANFLFSSEKEKGGLENEAT
ncbi:MAG: hypothetical protein K2J80_09090 [Oscillospiraceae bacterium]|nr:hypothetical protein [Oscillospiraceae bacterium]